MRFESALRRALQSLARFAPHCHRVPVRAAGKGTPGVRVVMDDDTLKQQELARVTRERDEARAEVSRLTALLKSDQQDAEERGAYWSLKAGARVVYATVGDDAYWMLAREVCGKARRERGDDY